jgi:predicted esterase
MTRICLFNRVCVRLSTLVSASFLGVALSACGGGGNSTGGNPGNLGGSSSTTPPPVVAAPARGSLIGGAALVPVVVSGTQTVNTADPQTLTAMLEAVQTGFSKVTGAPVCSVTAYTVQYNTVGGQAEATNASAAIMVPSGSDPSCSGARPVMLYAHGTTADKTYNMARIGEISEPRLIAAIFAAQGFIVVAPNYTGYDVSTLGYHPYLNAEAQSADMVDALRAARTAFATIGATPSTRLLVTGYSQGGYVALATQRAMQTEYASEFTVAGASGMSGPYALSLMADTVFGGSPTMGVTLFLPLLINSTQHSSTPTYTLSSDVYEAAYAPGIETLLPGLLSTGDLVSEKKLPATALFAADSQPQGAGASAYFAAGNLIKSSYRSAYLADAAAHPCSVDPASPLACSPQNGLRKFTVNNDLRTYLPTVPLMLCGGQNDPTVPFYNTSNTSAYFASRGLTSSALTVVDLETTQGALDPYLAPKLGFAAAKAALRADAIAQGEDADTAVASSYHAGLVAPFCLISTRDFFLH